MELRAGFELEWLVAEAEPGSAPRPALPGGPYGADRLVESLDYASALLEALEAAELPWLQFHPEFGASQFELSLAPGTALEAADRLVAAGGRPGLKSERPQKGGFAIAGTQRLRVPDQ